MINPQTKQFLESLCFVVRGTAGDDLGQKSLRVVAAIASKIDARITSKSFPAMSHQDFHQLCAAFSRQRADCMGAARSDIITIQRQLQKINADIRPTGKVDAATVIGVNSVFNGWDDAPPELATGRLTAAQISKNARTVAKFLKKAIGESTTFADVSS